MTDKKGQLAKYWRVNLQLSPETENECERTKMIEHIQRNVNRIVKDQCKKE